MRRLSLSIALLLAALLLAAMAQGELIQRGNLRVAFNGRLFPRALPRTHLAPVTVQLGGSVATTDGSRPPRLQKISVEMNRAGRIFVAGLPVCTAGELQQTTTAAALALCRDALVGHGTFNANVDFPNAPLIPTRGKVLAFNARIHGGPAMLLHIYGSTPVRLTFVLPFGISRRSDGEFGTVFSTQFPKLASNLGYVTDIELTLGRKYGYRGRQRSFLSASCAAPAGFPGATFQLAKATFTFAEGQRLSTGLTRDCRVR